MTPQSQTELLNFQSLFDATQIYINRTQFGWGCLIPLTSHQLNIYQRSTKNWNFYHHLSLDEKLITTNNQTFDAIEMIITFLHFNNKNNNPFKTVIISLIWSKLKFRIVFRVYKPYRVNFKLTNSIDAELRHTISRP